MFRYSDEFGIPDKRTARFIEIVRYLVILNVA